MKQTMATRLLACLCILSTTGCIGTSSSMEEAVQTEVVIPLGQPPRVITGTSWGGTGAHPSRIFSFHQPTSMIVVLPSGKQHILPSSLSILTQEDNTIIQVMLTPMLDAGTFQDGVATVRKLVEQFGIHKHPRVMKRLAEWGRETPDSSVSTGGLLEDRVDCFLEIRPHYERGGWYVNCVIDFVADDKLWHTIKAVKQ